mmetsp:Transcript_18916/g.35075  ORF Transcript_18916/g.35075 Transcript_18916/m.35075 type:complete len:262 (+) Transcript_18916:726-1511(+)
MAERAAEGEANNLHQLHLRFRQRRLELSPHLRNQRSLLRPRLHRFSHRHEHNKNPPRPLPNLLLRLRPLPPRRLLGWLVPFLNLKNPPKTFLRPSRPRRLSRPRRASPIRLHNNNDIHDRRGRASRPQRHAQHLLSDVFGDVRFDRRGSVDRRAALRRRPQRFSQVSFVPPPKVNVRNGRIRRRPLHINSVNNRPRILQRQRRDRTVLKPRFNTEHIILSSVHNVRVLRDAARARTPSHCGCEYVLRPVGPLGTVRVPVWD